MATDLDVLRASFDRLNGQLAETRANRQQVVGLVAAHQAMRPGRVDRPQRDHEILARLSEKGKAGEPDACLLAPVYREIFDDSVRHLREHGLISKRSSLQILSHDSDAGQGRL